MSKKNVDKMNLKILFYEMVSNSHFLFFVKSYASVPLPKMQIFKKKKKIGQIVAISKCGTKTVCATLKTNDTTYWHNCSTNIDPGAKNDNISSKQNLKSFNLR